MCKAGLMPSSSTSHSIKRSWPCNQSKRFRISYQHWIHISHNISWLCIWYRDDSTFCSSHKFPPAIAYILRFPRVEDDTHLTSFCLSLHLGRNINTISVKTTVGLSPGRDAMNKSLNMPEIYAALFPSEATYIRIKACVHLKRPAEGPFRLIGAVTI